MWQIYYSDGKVIRDTPPPARRYGVIAIAEPDPNHNWTFHVGKDWYLFLHTGWWIGVDNAGLYDYILNQLDRVDMILQGRTLPTAEYQPLIDRMMKECRPSKTGWHRGER